MKQKYQFELDLTREELNHFFWIVYGASFVDFENATGATEAYRQMADKLESILTQNDPSKIELIAEVKKTLRNSSNTNHKMIN